MTDEPQTTDENLDLSGKTEPKAEAKRTRGRPSKETVRTDVGKAVREGLVELADWIKERDVELGEILERDAARMANVLAGRAAKHQRVAKWVERVFGQDGPLGVLRAFGPFLRALIDRLPPLPVFGAGDEFPPFPEDELASHVPEPPGEPSA